MDSTFPQDLLDLKLHVDHWRTTRRFIREALPSGFGFIGVAKHNIELKQ